MKTQIVKRGNQGFYRVRVKEYWWSGWRWVSFPFSETLRLHYSESDGDKFYDYNMALRVGDGVQKEFPFKTKNSLIVVKEIV